MRWVKTSLLHKPPHRVKVGFIEGEVICKLERVSGLTLYVTNLESFTIFLCLDSVLNLFLVAVVVYSVINSKNLHVDP